MNATLGGLVRAAMEARRLKGYQLADRIGKGGSFVSKLINDEIKETLPVADMMAIERELGIPQVAMLRALGYAIPEANDTTALPFGSERATLVALMSEITEEEARVLWKTARILQEERQARDLVESETAALGIS
jgi:transcriptional regulator with XRE-family HTH domain